MEAFDPALNSDVAEFDIERSTAEAWASFAAKLTDVLSVMEDDASLTIGAIATEHPGRAPFVTFSARPAGAVAAEAASNAQLGEFFQLTPAQLEAMEAIGWQPPTAEAQHPGFWLEGTQEGASDLADKAVRALCDVYGVPHPAFLAPDQLAEILTPPAVAELPSAPEPQIPPEELIATMPASREQLDQLIEQELTALLGHAPVRDTEGDFGIRVGSTMVFVRSTADAHEVLVFSAVVHDIDGRSRAMEVLSDLNTDSRFVRFLLIRDRVFLSLSVFARPFVPAHLRQALHLVSLTADSIDNDLAAKLRGRTTFTDDGSGPAE